MTYKQPEIRGGDVSLIIFEKGASKMPTLDSYFCIVKIQVSISGEQKTLIYNKEKTFVEEMEFKFGKKWLKDDLKGYFKVKIKSGNIRILKRVNDKDW